MALCCLIEKFWPKVLLLFQFVALLATLALANAGYVEQPSYAYAAAPVKTVVQPVAYAADHHHYSAPASSSSSFTKTVSYSQPKAYVAAQPAIASYHSYEPEHHYVQNYHAEPQQHVYASPVYGHYEHGTSEQNIVRSAHGTVSHISKSVDTPHSSVRKYDTRVINDGYKTVQYSQPAAYVSHQPTAYVSHQPAVHTYAQPAVHSYAPAVVAQPLLTKAISTPVVSKTIVSAPVVAKTVAVAHQPTHYQTAYAQPAHYQTSYAQPQYQTYAQHAPVLASKVHYSPAIEVAHASFESPVAHYSW